MCLGKAKKPPYRLRLENFPRSASSSIFCMDLLSAFNIARFKFQGSSSNTLEVMSICLNHIGWKNSGRIVRLSLKIWPAMNLNRVQVFWKKVWLQDFGSRRIKQFPIDCTPLLKTIFQKNILWFFFLSPRRATQKFFKVFWKKSDLTGFWI